MGAGGGLLALLRVLLGRVLPTFVHGESQEGPQFKSMPPDGLIVGE